MNKKAIIISTIIFWGSFFAENTFAQKVLHLNLEQAVEYAYSNNYGLINSGKDLELAKQKIKESIAEGLPQINASVTYHDNVARPVFFLPGDLAGKPGQTLPVQFGTRYDANLSGQFTQLIFDARYFIGLKAAKASLERTNKDFFKNKLAVKEKVSETYFQILSVKEGLHIIDSTLAITKKLYIQTKKIYKEGLLQDTDVDQLSLMVSNLKASRAYMQNQYRIATALFKFYLGLKEKDSVLLSQNLPELINLKDKQLISIPKFEVNQNIDLLTVKAMKRLSKLQVGLARAAYFPSINGIVNYETQAQRPVWNFFNSQKWYQSAVIGITMRIPVFSSGKRWSSLKQAKLNYEKTQILEKQTADQLKIQFQTLKNEYENSIKVYINKRKNKKIAEKIYNKTLEKYIQGMASSLDLLNTHNQFLTAENGFINAEFSLLQAAEKLQNLTTKAN